MCQEEAEKTMHDENRHSELKMDTAVSISVMDKAICRVSRAGARECHVPQAALAVPTTNSALSSALL
jgi:hypothetical protein